MHARTTDDVDSDACISTCSVPVKLITLGSCVVDCNLLLPELVSVEGVDRPIWGWGDGFVLKVSAAQS